MSALKMCPTCGAEYPANERFCPRDGTALRSQGSDSTDLVGSVIAERYHVIRKLGEGGMGQVYLAEHVKMGRKSAVKVMHPGMVHDSDAISRFNREAANASRINHPNVAGIYDFGETPDGLIYLAMEFIEGEALTDIVKANGALPARRAADITRQAGEALAVAHDMGIVHRDLKPDNIMIAKNRDGSDCVKVVDFGIAKAANSEAQKVTRTGMVVGTPEYMSPEQLAGDKLDGRSDTYSLGLVAFNMLTGKLPFPSETVQESMIMRLTDRPRQLAEMAPSVQWPAEVQAVMDKALERDATLRYQSASDFGRALHDAVSRMPADATTAAGTMVMGGLTAPLPATRVASAADNRPAPGASRADGAAVVAAKSRTPMLVGGGVLAVAAVVAGVLFMPHGSPTQAAGAQEQRTVAAPAANVVPVGNASPAATPGAGETTVPPTAAPVSKVPSGTATPARTASAGNFKSLLDSLDRMAEEDGPTAQRALTRLDAVANRAESVGDRARVAIIRAQAYGSLGQDDKACSVLKAALPQADPANAERMKAIQQLASCP